MFSPLSPPQAVRCPECNNLAAVTICYLCGHDFLPIAGKRGSPLHPDPGGGALSLKPEQFTDRIGHPGTDVLEVA